MPGSMEATAWFVRASMTVTRYEPTAYTWFPLASIASSSGFASVARVARTVWVAVSTTDRVFSCVLRTYRRVPAVSAIIGPAPRPVISAANGSPVVASIATTPPL